MSFSSVVRARSTSASVTGSRAGPSSAREQRRARRLERARPSAAWRRSRPARVAQHALVAPGRAGQAGLHQRAVQAAGGRVAVDAAPARRSPGSRGGSPAGTRYSARDDLHVAGAAQRHRALAVLRRLRGVERGQRARRARDRAEVLLHQRERLRLVELAADDQQRVVGLVPGAVEGLQALDRHRSRCRRASRSPGCRSCAPRRRGAACARRARCPARSRRISNSLRTTVISLSRSDLRTNELTMRSASRPSAQSRLSPVAGQRLEVVGAVVGGGAVEARAALVRAPP